MALSGEVDAALDLQSPLVWVISLLMVTITASLIRSKQKKEARRADLKQLVARTLEERDAMQHACLEEVAVEEDDDIRNMTASNIRDLVADGKLDPSIHVVRLAKRCRRFGRDEARANAITEEFYDEVSGR